jgi:hypothetical protein
MGGIEGHGEQCPWGGSPEPAVDFSGARVTGRPVGARPPTIPPIGLTPRIPTEK